MRNQAYPQVMAERTAHMLQLRCAGWSFERIGAEVGLSGRRVGRILRWVETLALIEELFDDSLDV